ncbi:hypothetical protein BGX38DRAFT_65825 [Terfezia claveryi]|nr:hypothetical protein BGX38DRAFT_65825 [Terfezia claveryi]
MVGKVYLTIAISFLSPSLIQSFTITDSRLGYWPLWEGMIVAMTGKYGAFHIYCKYTSLPIYTFYYSLSYPLSVSFIFTLLSGFVIDGYFGHTQRELCMLSISATLQIF